MKYQKGDTVQFNPDGRGIYINDDMLDAHEKSPVLTVLQTTSHGNYYCHSPHFKDGRPVGRNQLLTWEYTESYLKSCENEENLLQLRNHKHITDEQFLERRSGIRRT